MHLKLLSFSNVCHVCVCVSVTVRLRMCVCAHLSRIYHSGAGLNTGVVVDLATVVAVVGGCCKGRSFIKEILQAFRECHIFIKENFKTKAARASCQSLCAKKAANKPKEANMTY